MDTGWEGVILTFLAFQENTIINNDDVARYERNVVQYDADLIVWFDAKSVHCRYD